MKRPVPKTKPTPKAPALASMPADVRVAAIRAKAAAEVKRKAADIAQQEADRLLAEHEATRIEAERLMQEHAAQEAEAQRLAEEADAQAAAAHAAKPWHQRLFGR